MISQQPCVSVVIPAYNYARFLPIAVQSAQQQRGTDFSVEVIVVDDGSTDDTAEVAASLPGIRYIHQENQGLSAARNTGMQAARGDFLLFLDADDLLAPQVIATHLAALARHPDWSVSISLCLQLFEDHSQPNSVWPLFADHIDVHMCNANVSPVHTYMIRTEAARSVGLFDTSLKACEDQDFWLRCLFAGHRFGINPDGLVIYRRHGESMTANVVRQYIHDAAMHFRIGNGLDTAKDFPPSGKFAGWLAHAMGCLACATVVGHITAPLSHRLFREFLRSVEQAVNLEATRSCQADMAAIQLFYASWLLIKRREALAVVPSDLRQDVIRAVDEVHALFPGIQDDDSLLPSVESLNKRLIVDPDVMLRTAHRYLRRR
ncbi:glycosyltransferase family A protein [uncultured Desulfovibrio sp.]|uniref:glycosyltransferase family 2 protein n=1 Tax=uncultured Desulfovibrio sp. TaxID=167968 RepID=UPI002623978E|nr:glycosyltransferase family A protein [uncultured Desulfovibrio sp.]